MCFFNATNKGFESQVNMGHRLQKTCLGICCMAVGIGEGWDGFSSIYIFSLDMGIFAIHRDPSAHILRRHISKL
jgi:hypothetical protein